MRVGANRSSNGPVVSLIRAKKQKTGNLLKARESRVKDFPISVLGIYKPSKRFYVWFQISFRRFIYLTLKGKLMF